MDKPTDSRGPNDIPGPDDFGSDQDFGATGVFKAVEPSEAKTEPAASQGAGTGAPGNRPADPFNPPSFMGSRPLAAPVVHKVVLGGEAESSPELLDRIRMASQERASTVEKPAAAPPTGGKPGGGFTELLRTLDVETPSATAAAKGTPPPEARPAAQDSGFTSLLRTLNAQEPAATGAAEPTRVGQPVPAFIPEEPRRVPPASVPVPGPVPGPAPSAGGFTELLRTAPNADPMMTYPLGSRPATVSPPAENKPGTFTQLFGSLGGAETTPPAPSPVERADSSGGSAGSFTRMLSLEPQPAAAELPRFEESKPVADRLNYGLTPEAGRPAAASSPPFSEQPFSEPEPAPVAPQSSGVGITRLIQMLDEPSKAPMQQSEAPPARPAPGPGPGVWTQTFASLSSAGDPPAPAAKAPDWAPPQAPPPAAAYPPPPAAHPAPSLTAPAVSAPPAASGPSEFTRILDASRMRELAMRGGQAGAAEGAAAATPPPVASSPPASIPSYPVPVSSPAVGMQGGGAMARPVVYPPSVPQAPGMYAPTPQVPQAPGMYVPTPPMPSTPPAPPPKPAQPAAGGLQQMVPILLVVVIVLLIVLIVTVIFMMKH